MLARFNLDFIHNLLDVWHFLSQLACFRLLRSGLYAALQNEGSVFGRIVNALIVEMLVGFQRRLVVVLDRAIEIRIYRLRLAFCARGTYADFVRYGVVRSRLLGEGLGL